MLRTQVNLREDQYQILRIQAKKENESLSEIVRKLIDLGVKSHRQENNAYILLEMVKEAGKSGEKHLATTYKRLLYGQTSSKK